MHFTAQSTAANKFWNIRTSSLEYPNVLAIGERRITTDGVDSTTTNDNNSSSSSATDDIAQTEATAFGTFVAVTIPFTVEPANSLNIGFQIQLLLSG